MKKWIELSFDVGDTVYLKTDDDQKKRIVTSIHLKQSGVVYELCQGTVSTWHYDFEISHTADIVTKTSD